MSSGTEIIEYCICREKLEYEIIGNKMLVFKMLYLMLFRGNSHHVPILSLTCMSLRHICMFDISECGGFGNPCN